MVNELTFCIKLNKITKKREIFSVYLLLLNCLLKTEVFIFLAGERAMSPAQSEDSGLAADRGTTYATISLPRENSQAMGIVFLGKSFQWNPFKT